MLKFRLLFAFIICSMMFSTLRAQLLYDPTWVYDGPGQLYEFESLYEVRLNFYSADYHDTLTNRWHAGNDERLAATFEMDGESYDSVGVKYKGNSTFYLADLVGNPKVPYNIDMNYYVGGQKVKGYKKLKLANAFLDPTFAKEASASYIYRNYLPTHQAALVKLFVNGSYLGVYVSTESVGKQFLDKHFKEKNGAFMKCEPLGEFGGGSSFVPADLLWRGSSDSMDYYESYERKSDSLGWPEFIEMIDVLNNDPANAATVLNIDRVLWYFAVTTVLPNEDAYNTHVIHNYYMYQTGDGKWQMIPWDLSETYGGALVAADGGTDVHYFRDPQFGFDPYAADRPLVYNLLSNNYYRKRFLHHVRTVMDEFYDSDEIKSWVMDFQANGYDAIADDPNKSFSMAQLAANVTGTVFWFFTEIGGITSTIDERQPFLAAHPEVVKVPPVIEYVEQNIDNPSSTDVVYISAKVTGTSSVKLKVTNTDKPYASDYTAIDMVDDGTGGDLTAGDDIYTAAVPFTTSDDHVKYYVEAENTDAMAISPKRAEYFYYHYYVDQVVGEDEIAQNVHVSLYPNPASEQVNIKGTKAGTDILMLNMNGQVLQSKKSNAAVTSFDISDYSAGVYFIIINDGNASVRKKFVVTK